MNIKQQKTKIIATVGPACNTYEKLIDLVKAGVDVFRLNFSHGTHDDHKNIIQLVTKINENYPVNIAILADLQGPKLRIGKVENDLIEINENDEIIFTQEKVIGNAQKLYISYPNFSSDVSVGEKILLDDGKLEMEILEIKPNADVLAKVLIGGLLGSKKGVNLPDTKISLPALTQKDLEDIDFIVTQNIDWLALSFVRSPEDIFELKKILKGKNSEIKIIAKIEKPEAIVRIREIILASDAIMIARGDLGVELPVEQIPMIQKNIVRKCIHRAKPVIIATQMMESMIERTKPNRSEITDVANAVLEGADAVMLSGETAMGNHPSLVVETMSKIIAEVENEAMVYNKNLIPQSHSPSFLSDAVCYNACEIAQSVQANAIIGNTQSGYTAFMLSSFRPRAKLFIFTKTKSLVNQLSLSWGVKAYFYDKENSLDEIIKDQIENLKSRNLLAQGEIVISTGSTPVADHLPTNLIKVDRVN
ncbi:MAG: pyruvate kinase [Chitinophagaceae bacterium]|nr:pyruvate kinase [Chitinophagaceae bacterium]